MDITPLKQKYYHGCLVTCFLMISKMTDQSIEQRIFFEGEKRKLDNYVSNMLFSFVGNTKLSLEVFVDNKYFAESLSKELKRQQKSIIIVQQKITAALIDKMLEKGEVILHIDDNYLGDYSHASHFIVIERKVGDKYSVIDPISGTRKTISQPKLEASILSLKAHIKMCPLLIRKI